MGDFQFIFFIPFGIFQNIITYYFSNQEWGAGGDDYIFKLLTEKGRKGGRVGGQEGGQEEGRKGDGRKRQRVKRALASSWPLWISSALRGHEQERKEWQ